MIQSTILLYCIYLFDIIVLYHAINAILKAFLLKPDSYLSYKMLDKKLSVLVVIIYIVIFYIFVNYQRVLYYNRNLNLKVMMEVINTFISSNEVSLILKITLSILAIQLIIFLLLCACYLHKILSIEIYKCYLYLNYRAFLITGSDMLLNAYHEQARIKKTKYYGKLNKFTIVVTKFFGFCCTVSNRNILRYFITDILNSISDFLQDMQKIHTRSYHDETLQNYPGCTIFPILRKFLNATLFNTKINIFDTIFKITPIVVIIYDCLLNNFVLHYIFIYMIFYVPIVLFHRITKCVSWSDTSINNLIWEMCYKQDNCIYLATEKNNKIFMYFIRNGLLGPFAEEGPLERVFLSEKLYIFDSSPLHYVLHEKEHEIYINDSGEYAQRKPDGTFHVVQDYLFEQEFENLPPFIEYGEKLTVLLNKLNNI